MSLPFISELQSNDQWPIWSIANKVTTPKECICDQSRAYRHINGANRGAFWIPIFFQTCKNVTMSWGLKGKLISVEILKVSKKHFAIWFFDLLYIFQIKYSFFCFFLMKFFTVSSIRVLRHLWDWKWIIGIKKNGHERYIGKVNSPEFIRINIYF